MNLKNVIAMDSSSTASLQYSEKLKVIKGLIIVAISLMFLFISSLRLLGIQKQDSKELDWDNHRAGINMIFIFRFNFFFYRMATAEKIKTKDWEEKTRGVLKVLLEIEKMKQKTKKEFSNPRT